MGEVQVYINGEPKDVAEFIFAMGNMGVVLPKERVEHRVQPTYETKDLVPHGVEEPIVSEPEPEVKPVKRKRRTKAEIEEAKAQEVKDEIDEASNTDEKNIPAAEERQEYIKEETGSDDQIEQPEDLDNLMSDFVAEGEESSPEDLVPAFPSEEVQPSENVLSEDTPEAMFYKKYDEAMKSEDEVTLPMVQTALKNFGVYIKGRDASIDARSLLMKLCKHFGESINGTHDLKSENYKAVYYAASMSCPISIFEDITICGE